MGVNSLYLNLSSNEVFASPKAIVMIQDNKMKTSVKKYEYQHNQPFWMIENTPQPEAES